MHSGIKRGFDAVVAAAALLIASPVILVLAALVAANLGAPVFFRQRRPGLHGRPFTLLKFRTMRPARPGENEVASDASRLTALGRWMRNYSLDELPQLWNVLR